MPRFGHALRRFTDHKPAGSPYELSPSHPAAVDGTSLFRARVAFPGSEPLLKSGMHNRKIGKRVVKGRWAGMPIYTLTLEERATCPRTCSHWLDCYGNKMNWSTRWRHGPELEKALDRELHLLARQHRRGFVVRLHVLGDFYSSAYVDRWLGWLVAIPQLHVWGYTARRRDSAIGERISYINEQMAPRWVVRFSEDLGELGTVTIYSPNARGNTPLGVVCPAQTDDSECCGTCGLCWQSKCSIVFLAH